MSDIVERLLSMTREDPGAIPPESVYGEWIIAAADEIVRLRTEVARKDAALRPFADALKGNWSAQGDALPLKVGPWVHDLRLDLTLGDFREARAAIAEAADRIAKLESDLSDALTDPNTAGQWRPTHRHRKRGSTYQVVCEGTLQCEDWASDYTPVTIYRAEDGATWVRPTDEFNDGRFMPLLPPPTGETSDE